MHRTHDRFPSDDKTDNEQKGALASNGLHTRDTNACPHGCIQYKIVEKAIQGIDVLLTSPA